MNNTRAVAALHAYVAFAARMLDLERMFKQAIDNIQHEPEGVAHVLTDWAYLVAHSSGMAEEPDWVGLGLVDSEGNSFTPDEAPEWAWPQVQAARIITAAANDDRLTADAVAHAVATDVRCPEVLTAMADILTAPVKPRIVPPSDLN